MQDLRLVANLQTIARPYVSLYIDTEKHDLYILIKSSIKIDNQPAYLVIPVTKAETLDYLNRKVRLRQLYAHKTYNVATIGNENKLNLADNKNITKSTIRTTGKLDPEFCSNMFKIMYYVQNLNQA